MHCMPSYGHLYAVNQKGHSTFADNFAKCRAIFKTNFIVGFSSKFAIS